MGFFDSFMGARGGGGGFQTAPQPQTGSLKGGMVNLGKLGPSGGAFGPLYGNQALNNPALRPTIGGGGEGNVHGWLARERQLNQGGPSQPIPIGGGGVWNSGAGPDPGNTAIEDAMARMRQMQPPGAGGYQPSMPGAFTDQGGGGYGSWEQAAQARGPWGGGGGGSAYQPQGGGGLIRLVAPTGEQQDVPAAMAEQMLARGARRI